MAKKYPKMAGVLKKLLFARDMKSIDLAREVDLPPPTIHRLIKGKSTRPHPSSIERLTNFFDITPEQLLGEEALANEKAITGNNSTEVSTNRILELQLIPWKNIIEKDSVELDDSKTVPFIGNIGDDAFASIMPDSSMEPIFSRDSLLIFDPAKVAKDRSYILVQLAENKIPVFRQLLVDLDHKYLKPLNPDLNAFQMRLLDDDDTVLAVLVEARQVYDET